MMSISLNFISKKGMNHPTTKNYSAEKRSVPKLNNSDVTFQDCRIAVQ